MAENVAPAAPAAAPAPAPAPVNPGTTPAQTPAPATSLVTEPTQALAPADPNKPADVAPIPAAPAAPLDMSTITMPAGLELSPEQSTEFAAVAAGLPKEQVEKILAFGQKQLAAAVEAPSQMWADTNKKWIEEVKADPVIGGANWDTTHQRISKLLSTHGSPELNAALNETGAGNNPEIIRFLNKIGTALTEGAFIPGMPTSGQPDLASLMYPKSPQSGAA